jgi:hypothetical protein
MISILKGETMQIMKAFYETHGPEQTSFRENPDATRQWMEKIATKGDTQENFPLPTIRYMLHIELRTRPTARTVTEKLQLADSGLSFCGAYCMHEDSDSIFETEQSVDGIDPGGVLSGIQELLTEPQIHSPSLAWSKIPNNFQIPLMPLRRRASAVSDMSDSTQCTQLDMDSIARFAHDHPLFSR